MKYLPHEYKSKVDIPKEALLTVFRERGGLEIMGELEFQYRLGSGFRADVVVVTIESYLGSRRCQWARAALQEGVLWAREGTEGQV